MSDEATKGTTYSEQRPIEKRSNFNSRVLIIAVILFFIIVIITLIVLWWITGRDVNRYEKLIQDIEDPPDDPMAAKAADGPDGKDAYEIFLEMNPGVDITESEFEAKYVGADGEKGPDAPPADNGSRGSDGTTGDVGNPGAKGGTGNSGGIGNQGVEGEATIVVTNIGDVPAGALSYEVVTATAGAPTLELFVDGVSFTTFTATYDNTGTATAFISFIVYDENFRITAFTSPLTLPNYRIDTPPDSNSDVTVSWTALPMNYKVRANLSLNKGNVLSAFTNNVIEKNLDTEAFVYKRPLEKDPFAKKFYDIIAGTAALQVNEFEFDDKIAISAASSTNITINIRTA